MAKLHGKLGLAGATHELERATTQHWPLAKQCWFPHSGPSEDTSWRLAGQTVSQVVLFQRSQLQNRAYSRTN